MKPLLAAEQASWVSHFKSLSSEPISPCWMSWPVHEARKMIMDSNYAQKILFSLAGYMPNQLEVCSMALVLFLHFAYKLLS